MKKLYTRRFFIAIFALLCSVTASAYDFKVGKIFYNITDEANFTVEVTYGVELSADIRNDYTGNIVIPSSVSYNGKSYSVTSIGVGAFYNCSGLTSVTIGNSVTSIGVGAFLFCSGLTSVVIGNSVTSIGDDAFAYCSGLTSVTIPNSVTSIGEDAFMNCEALASVEIPNSVASIGKLAFCQCYALTSVTIPNSVTSIEEGVFFNCESLTNVVIPNSVTSIGKNAFGQCYSLTNVTIGNSVTSIGESAFYNCHQLRTFVSENRTPPAVHSSAFKAVRLSAVLYVPYKTKNKYANSVGWDYFKNIKEFQKSYKVTYYIDGKQYAVYDVKEGESIVYPKVDEKEGYTFNWNTNIDIMPSNDIVIEGTFSLNNYAIIYKIDGEVYATDSVAYGAEIKLLNPPSKEGYTFSGWSEAPATMPAKDVTISGTLAVNYYNLIYMINGAEYLSTSVAYGSAITLIAAPVKEGYTFSGWSEAPATMPAKDVTINGTLKINYYMLIYVVDGETYKVESYAYGDAIKLIAAPEKEGYIFSGWSEVPATMPAVNTVITGSFVQTNITGVADDATVKVGGNCITVSGANNCTVAVYTAGGALVEKIDSYTGEEITLDKGVYIIRVGNRAIKVKI